MAAKAGKPQGRAAIYVVVGKDRFLVETECAKLLDELIPQAEREMGLICPEAGRADVTELLDELRTPGFLAPHKVILLKDADNFISLNRDILERYFDSPSPSGTLILAVSSWLKTTILAKKLPAVGKLIATVEYKDWQLPDFAIRYASEKHGKAMSKATAQVLVELVGDEPGLLAGQVDKLAMFAEGRKGITAEDVTAIVGRNRFFDAFEVIGAMTAGDTGTAISRLRSMFKGDKDSEYTVVGAFAFHFRRMFTAKGMLAKGEKPDQMAPKLRLWGSNKDAFFNQVQRVSLTDIGSVLRRLAAIDHASKSGQGTASIAIEQLVVSMGAKQTAPAMGKRR
jgi:DNA polymerase III subunit delta